jgi:hypothetical protein
MIDPKELRIGNFIYCNTTHRIVEVQWVHADFKKLDPIPLTEDWLIKFGFEKKDSGYVKEGFNTIADYGSQHVSLHEGGAQLEFGYYENQLDCSFVHSLQNLYYAIMGEDLTIRELQP